MTKPAYHNTAMVYLIVKDPWILQDFLCTVFDAEMKIKLPDLGQSGRVHAEALIGDTAIMFSGANDDWQPQTAGIFIYVENADETLEKALRHHARIILPLQDQPYGRSGGIEDPCGNVWWITSIN